MKTLDPQLAAHLGTGATTLAWCWRLKRRDGATLGFTDHDRDILFDGTVFEAAAGLTTSEIRDGLGFRLKPGVCVDPGVRASNHRTGHASWLADLQLGVWTDPDLLYYFGCAYPIRCLAAGPHMEGG